MYDSNNIFARILRQELPSHLIHEDEHCIVILDIFPINPGHTLVIPKAAVEDFSELPSAVAAHVIQVGQRVAKAQKAAAKAGTLRCDGVNFLISDGPKAGQEIPHAHLHVLPRFEGDGFGFKFGAKNRKSHTPEALSVTAQTLKGNL